MQVEQALMIAGASIAGMGFALAGANTDKKLLYYTLGIGGVILVAFAYLKAVL